MVRIKPHPVKSKTFDTMRDAKAWAQKLEVKLRNEKIQVFDHIIFKDALIEYRDTVTIKKKGAKYETYKINNLLRIMKCDIPLKDVTKDFLIKWREVRLEKVQGATARRELKLLQGFFTWCIDVKSWLGENPVKGMQLPKASNHRERVISDEEVSEVTKYMSNELKDIFLLALETGMRQSEICRLTWDRVFIERSFLRLEVTKNGKAREVPLSNAAKEILKRYKVAKKTGRVFSYDDPAEICNDFIEAKEKGKMSGFTFHDARHTAATRIAQKIQVLDLCRMFGWSNPKQAMVYYNATATEIASRL